MLLPDAQRCLINLIASANGFPCATSSTSPIKWNIKLFEIYLNCPICCLLCGRICDALFTDQERLVTLVFCNQLPWKFGVTDTNEISNPED